MPTYTVHAINVGSFLLGESDKVLTLFTAEKGIIRAVAKGARKPGTKMSGRSDVLCANKLLLSSGKTFEIITQAESIEAFKELRLDLTRMSYSLYYAELTQHFGPGLSEESDTYFNFLLTALKLQARSAVEPSWLCLEYELGLLDLIGYRPELTCCVTCREVLGDYNLGTFNLDFGGVLCQPCSTKERSGRSVSEGSRESSAHQSAQITPLVWKNLALAASRPIIQSEDEYHPVVKLPVAQSITAARRLIHRYIEYRAGRHLKALDLLDQLQST